MIISITFDDGSSHQYIDRCFRSVRRQGLTGIGRIRTLSCGDAIMRDGCYREIVDIRIVDKSTEDRQDKQGACEDNRYDQ
jgi:hypothetical protein